MTDLEDKVELAKDEQELVTKSFEHP